MGVAEGGPGVWDPQTTKKVFCTNDGSSWNCGKINMHEDEKYSRQQENVDFFEAAAELCSSMAV